MASGTDYERKYGDSPDFTKTNMSSLATGAWLNIQFGEPSPDFSGSSKYTPLNFLSIRNGAPAGQDSQLEIYLNGKTALADLKALLKAGVSRVYDKGFISGGFRSLHIKNRGATAIGAYDIEVVAKRVGIEPTDVFTSTFKTIATKKGGSL